MSSDISDMRLGFVLSEKLTNLSETLKIKDEKNIFYFDAEMEKM